MKRLAAFAALALLAVPAAEAIGRRPPPLLADLPKSELQVVTASGTHRFQVWIAADQPSRERGLMFVREMPADWGMLFLFERPQYVAFWMKNTYLSLDIVFIDSDGLVVNIAKGTEPLSLQPIESEAPVKGVLELVSGTAARIRLVFGDRVVYPTLEVRKPD